MDTMTAAPVTEGRADGTGTGATSDAPVDGSADRAGIATAPARRTPGRKPKLVQLSLVVTGTPDGDWRAELKHGSTVVATDVEVAAAAVSRAARELHDDLAGPIDAMMEEARAQQAAKVAALEAQLDAARRTLADLD